MKNTLCIFLLFLTVHLSGQNTMSPDDYAVVEGLIELRIQSVKNEDLKMRWDFNKQFSDKLKDLIINNKDLIQLLDSIPYFGKVASPDKKLTIYTWNMVSERNEFTYFAFIDIKGEDLMVLSDESKNMDEPLVKQNKSSNWYGALYYEIIPTKVKKQGVHYMLLGWDGNSRNSTRKVIDILYFDKEFNNWYFGKNVFGPPFTNQKRFFIEYSSEVVVSLKYHPKTDQVVFDHCIPPNKGLEGIYDYYVPDMSFDAFEFRKDRWYFVQNVDVRGDQTMENYTEPPKIKTRK